MTLDEYLERAWKKYTQITPDAELIHQLLSKRGEKIINDHIAFRTFDIKGIDRHAVGAVFEAWGYRPVDELLEFPDKHLLANYYLPPEPHYPKVFISELVLKDCSKELQSWISGVVKVGQIQKLTAEHLLQPTWEPVTFEDYRRFYPESEYAAWTAAFGIQLNHFTVFFNALKGFSTLKELNDLLIQEGFSLNESGGLIKGTSSELLEQSSTNARRIPWKFSGGQVEQVLGCYYEFAKRYPVPGKTGLFQGFIPKSADKIFESTYEK